MTPVQYVAQLLFYLDCYGLSWPNVSPLQVWQKMSKEDRERYTARAEWFLARMAEQPRELVSR